MPMGFRDMHASSGHTVAELLRNLGAELTQVTQAISHVPSLSKMKSIEGGMSVTLAMLRRYINTLESPLYHLPLDLLLEVASYLASETDLVNATHVSYHLRSVLLSSPSLWSHLNFKNEMTTRAFFERSGRTPLHVDMVREVSQMTDSLAELRQQSNRVATLKLRRWPIQKRFLSESLPSLRRLEIFFERYDDEYTEYWDTWNPAWGPIEKATSWSFPSLTSLIIYNLMPIPFHTPHLTCFKFRQYLDFSTVNMLISFLNGCPLLEHIDVVYLDRGEDEREDERDLVASLPRLRTYTETTLDGGFPPTILNALSLPPFCSVTLRFHGDRLREEPFDATPPPLHFDNPDYLAEIKRVKLKTTHDADGNEIAGTLELINAKGTKVCSERERIAIGQYHRHNVAHLNLLRGLDGRSVEILCVDGFASQDDMGIPVEFLKETLSFGNVKTLVVSHGAVKRCLSALDEDPGASGNNRWFSPIDTLIIYSGLDQHLDQHDPFHDTLDLLLNVAQRRKAVGFPFKTVLLFLCYRLESRLDQVSERLRSCVEKLEVVTGDGLLDWDADKYFLDGLEHLQKNQDVRWD